ncbi:MAG: T9SS type A sorting domain-containing protein [Saprospiraceae bacterium]|nr:T9SS type A sorting domain-containing protein [Saprospiraceae bacterium]
MCKFKFVLLLFLGASFSVSGAALFSEGKNLLLLPPPTNVTVNEVGSTWARLSWDPVPGAAGYHVITRLAGSGTTVDDQIYFGMNANAHVQNLSAGNEYQSEIWTIDQLGDESESSSFSDFYETIIIDVVTNDFTVPSTCPTVCTLTTSNSCDFDWSGTTATKFTIRVMDISGTVVCGFKVVKTGDITAAIQPTTIGSGPTKFQFFESDNSTKLRITYKQEVAATIECSYLVGVQNIAKIKRLGGDSNKYPIYKHESCGGGGMLQGGADSRDAEEFQEPIELLTEFSASPNPFTESVLIQLPFADPYQPTSVNLYDLNGRMINRLLIPAGISNFNLSTETLAPGMYLLNAILNQEIHSLKLIKTQ